MLMQSWMNPGASGAQQGASNVNFFIGNSQNTPQSVNNGNGKWSTPQQQSGNTSSWSPVTNSPFVNALGGVSTPSSGVANESSLLTTNAFLKDD